MIFIQNRQRKILIDVDKLKKTVQKMLKILKYEDFDVSILLTTNATLRTYNREFRKKDKPTDILSFPYHTDLIAGKRIKVEIPEDKNLGDIVISLEYVQKKAPAWDRSFDEHLKALIAHGIVHLLNYDHMTDEEFKAMYKVETKLLEET